MKNLPVKKLVVPVTCSSSNAPTQHKTENSSLSLIKTSFLPQKVPNFYFKTRIYNETGFQNFQTNRDLEHAFAGIAHSDLTIESVGQKDQDMHVE